MIDAYLRLSEENEWPRSYNLYSGKIAFQIAAHSKEQALHRLKQLEEFLAGLFLDPEGEAEAPDPAVKYCIPLAQFNSDDPDREITFRETITVESMPEPSMGSGEIPEWSWLLPDADKDYDPSRAAHAVHMGAGEELDEQYENIVQDLADHGITYPFPRDPLPSND